MYNVKWVAKVEKNVFILQFGYVLRHYDAIKIQMSRNYYHYDVKGRQMRPNGKMNTTFEFIGLFHVG